VLVLDLRLPAAVTAGAEARAALRAALGRTRDPVVVEDPLIVPAELVSSSAMHAGLSIVAALSERWGVLDECTVDGVGGARDEASAPSPSTARSHPATGSGRPA
jgi:hypothetical protein